MKLRATPFFDPFHDPWRQLDISMAECGLKTSMILSSIGHNLDFGPWDGQAFWQQEKDTAAEVVALMGPDDPLLDFFWPRICWDLGLDPEADDAKEKYIKELKSFSWLKKKGPRVCMTRWGTWAEAHEFRAPYHHSRLLLLVALGLRAGWLTGRKPTDIAMLQKLTAKAARTEVPQAGSGSSTDPLPKATTKQGRSEATKLREKCHNSCHVVAHVLSDSHVTQDCSLLFYGVSFIRHSHNLLVKELRSARAAVEYAAKSANHQGHMWDACHTMARPFQQLARLETCGFKVCFDKKELARLAADDPFLLAQQLLAAKLFKFIISITFHLLAGQLASAPIYPWRFALLLHGDRSVQHECLDVMRQDWAAWKEVATSDLTLWKTIAQRSCMQWAFVRETFELAESGGWALTPALLAQCSRCFHQFAHTLIAECMFQKLTDHSDRDNANKHISCATLWRKPIKENILDSLFSYNAVRSDEVAPVTGTLGVPSGLHHPRNKRASLPGMKEIVSREKPSWPSFNGQSWQTIAGEHMLMRKLHAANTMASISGAWRAAVVQPGMLLVHAGATYFSMGLIGGYCLLLWPAIQCGTLGGQQLWGFKELGTGQVLELMPVVDFSEWQAICFSWLSPAAFCHARGEMPMHWGQGVASQTAGATGFLKVAAQHAFWNIKLPLLKKLARQELGVRLQATDIVEATFELIKHILGCSDKDAALCLESRCADEVDDPDLWELLGSVEAEENLSKEDHKEACKVLADIAEQREVSMKVRQKVKEAMGSSSSSSSTTSGKRKFVGSQTAVPDLRDKWTEENVNKFAPPNCKVRCDLFNGRWEMHYKIPSTTGASKYLHASRSWGSRSHKDCVLQLMKWAWQHAEAHGERCPYSGFRS